MLKEIAPPNLLNDPVIKALLESTDPQLQKVKEQIINVIIYPRIDEIEDESLLDLLAWQFHVEGYELAQTIEEKRNLVKNAIELHKNKGTKYAVEGVLRFLNLPGEIQEWFEYDGEPYRFKVEVSSPSRQITPELRDRLIQLINEYKNERSWLDELILSYLVNTVSKSSAGCVSETETDVEIDRLFECEATETLKLNAGSIAEIAQNTKLSEFLANTDTFLKVYSAVAAETESFAIFEFQQEVVAPTSLKAFCVAELQSYAGGSL